MKICKFCKVSKPLNDFYKSKGYAGGYNTLCKICKRLKLEESRMKHIDARKLYSRLYRANLRKVNPDKAYKWSKENPERARLLIKEWHQANPERSKAICRKAARKRRAIKAKIKQVYSKQDELKTRTAFNNLCFKCQSALKTSIDHHFPLSKGFALSLSNAVLLCKSCNSSKGNKLPDQFYSKEELATINKILDSIK